MSAFEWAVVIGFLSVVAIVLLAIAAVRGKQLAPDSAENIRSLVEALHPLLAAQRDLYETVSKELINNPGLAAKTPAPIAEHNDLAAKHAREAYVKIWDALKTEKASTTAGSVRAYVFVGSFFALLGAAAAAYAAYVSNEEQKIKDAQARECKCVVVQAKSQ